MTARFDWSGVGIVLVIAAAATAATAWQVALDRSPFERWFGPVEPVIVMLAATVVGVVALAHLQASSDLAIVGPGGWREAATIIAWAVPVVAIAAIVADLALRFDEDTNVGPPDALRFYPAIAVFVEFVVHAVPIAVLVALVGPPTGLDATFWRIAVPVALIEAVLQAAYAPSPGLAAFSGLHLMVFGVAQVWVFWRFGFVWMLGFRLTYYALWHLAWGAARLELLF